MNAAPERDGARGLRALFLVWGIAFALAGVVYSTPVVRALVHLVRRLLHHPWTHVPDPSAIHRAQFAYLALAALALACARVVGRPGRAWVRRRTIQNLVLAFVALAAPLSLVEVALRPLTPNLGRSTALFVRDARLGWRMRPHATQPWGGVTVHTNSAGLRGPDVPRARTPQVTRILWLGDSVTFGYRVARWQDVFPFVVERRLRARGLRVETIDSGVGGYAPWQERAWFEDEGVAWRPDLVVLGFVLNDVTEMYTLARYGGREEGYQLRNSYASWLDRVAAHSALVTRARDTIRHVIGRRRLGANPRLAAIHRERLDIEALVARPDRPGLRPAWDRVFGDIGAVTDTCAAHGWDFTIVAFPFTMQLAAPDSLDGPQRMLEQWARARGIRFVDVMPALVRAMRADSLGVRDLFVDADHLTPRGHAVVADTLARVLEPVVRGVKRTGTHRAAQTPE